MAYVLIVGVILVLLALVSVSSGSRVLRTAAWVVLLLMLIAVGIYYLLGA